MIPPPDDTSERPDGPVEGSLGERSAGADLESAASEGPHSLGDQSTAGDIGSSVSDLDDLGVGLDDDLEIVDLEARYEIRDTLGRGGMGEVFRAADRRLGRDVAIKRLRDELGASRQAAERFLTEAKSIAALNHFNIVQIFDYGRASDGPFIVMEYVGGGSLAETLAEGRLEQTTAVELIDQLCQALTVTHAQGVIHRDIKPANVLMTRDGVPKLTDFGLARQESVDGGHHDEEEDKKVTSDLRWNRGLGPAVPLHHRPTPVPVVRIWRVARRGWGGETGGTARGAENSDGDFLDQDQRERSAPRAIFRTP